MCRIHSQIHSTNEQAALTRTGVMHLGFLGFLYQDENGKMFQNCFSDLDQSKPTIGLKTELSLCLWCGRKIITANFVLNFPGFK